MSVHAHFLTTGYRYAIPEWYRSKSGKLLLESKGASWRLGKFFSETTTHSKVSSAEMGWKVGKAFGCFDRHLNGIEQFNISETIISFHSIKKYLTNLKSSIQDAPSSRLRLARPFLDKVDHFCAIAEYRFDLGHIIHNDAKISNILWRKEEVYAIIDWDTIMLGHLSWELADLIRTSAVTVSEDHPHLNDIGFDKDILEGVVVGWKSQAADILQEQKDQLLDGVMYIIFEQAIRFLEDYLAEDRYYKCDFDDHNLVRARNQFALLSTLYDDQFHYKQLINRA